MFYQIFRSPQMKRGTIISNKQGIHELPQELQNDLRLKVLGNQEIRGISQNSTELQPRNQPHFQNDSFVNTAKKNAEKSKLNFSHSALFHMKTRVFLKIFSMVVVVRTSTQFYSCIVGTNIFGGLQKISSFLDGLHKMVFNGFFSRNRLQNQPVNLYFLCIKRLRKYCWVICISCTKHYSCKLYIITVNHLKVFSLFHFELL